MKASRLYRSVCSGAMLFCTLLGSQLWAQHQGDAESLVATKEGPAYTSTTGPEVKPSQNFTIGNGDVLAISVWKQPDLSRSLPVRSDGKISLPLIGEVQAGGRTPQQLQQDLVNKLQPYLTDPEVTVIIEQINSQKFNILGRVVKPGSYALVDPTTVLDAIALAGGCRDFAKQKDIYILRRHPDGTESKLPFNYQDVIRGKNTAQNIELQPRDTIVVP